MKGSIALGWLLATVLFALLGNAILTVVFLCGSFFFGVLASNADYALTKDRVYKNLLKGETDES